MEVWFLGGISANGLGWQLSNLSTGIGWKESFPGWKLLSLPPRRMIRTTWFLMGNIYIYTYRYIYIHIYLYFSLRGDDPTETLKSKSLGALKQHIFSPKTALFHPFSEDFLCQFESNISTQTVETAEWRLALKWPVRFFLWNKNDLEMDGEPPSLKKSENAQIKTSTKYLSFNFSWRESIARFFLNMYCLYYKYKCLSLYTIPVFFQESHGFSTKKTLIFGRSRWMCSSKRPTSWAWQSWRLWEGWWLCALWRAAVVLDE